LLTVTVDLHIILDAEPYVVNSELWVWRDVGENGMNELVWEFENYENGAEQVST